MPAVGSMSKLVFVKILAALPSFISALSDPVCLSRACQGVRGEWSVEVSEAGRRSTVYVTCDDVPDRLQCGWSRRR